MGDLLLLMRVIVALIPVIKETFYWVKNGSVSSPEAFSTSLHATMLNVRNAKTPAEKNAAALDLHNLILKG